MGMNNRVAEREICQMSLESFVCGPRKLCQSATELKSLGLLSMEIKQSYLDFRKTMATCKTYSKVRMLLNLDSGRQIKRLTVQFRR